jgi:RNA polymerase sigma-70 factor (ECF subfamily)
MDGPESHSSEWFSTTHWTSVLAAKEVTSPQASEALEKLCRAYWWPLYAFVRRRGYDAPDAQDLTQEFFARLLEKNWLGSVDRAKGKFRSFLLAALEHFLANEWRRSQAQKRGGGVTFMSLDEEGAEQQYHQVATSSLTPEQLFEQQWATALLDQVLAELCAEFTATGKGAFFHELKISLTGEKRVGSYAELAAKLDTTEAALKMAVSRMRQRYGELLRAQIAHTVANAEEIEDELRALQAALSL